MKKHLVLISLFVLSLFYSQSSKAQGLAVNTTGVAADSSAILDANSTTQGILIPRVTNVQMNAINRPATGLMVYETDGAAGFYYNSGTPASPIWKSIGSISTAATVTTVTVPNHNTINTIITDVNTRFVIYNIGALIGGSLTINVTLPSPTTFPIGVPLTIVDVHNSYGTTVSFNITTPSGYVAAGGMTVTSGSFVTDGTNWYQVAVTSN